MSQSASSPAPVVLPPPAAPSPPPAPGRRAPWWNPVAWFAQWIRRAYDKQIDGTGLAIFRIVYCMVLLTEVYDAYIFRHLRYDRIPYLRPAEINVAVPILAWVVVILCLMVGLRTRLMAILNYCFTLALFASHWEFKYHMFAAWTTFNLVLIFQESGRVLSLDRLIEKLRYSNTRFRYEPPRTVSQLNYIVPLLLGCAIVYSGSMLYKLSSHGWRTGIGMWRPSSLPYVIYNTTGMWLLNMKWVILGLGFLTFLFEFFFIFLYTSKRWRIPLAVIGVGLHLGIAWQYPLWWFGLAFAGLYILLIPVGWWRWLFPPRKVSANPALTIYYDGECPLCARTRITLEHFDTRGQLRFLPVQTGAADAPALAGIPEAELLRTIYSVDASGRVYQGYATYRRALRAIWYLAPVGWLLSLPGLRHLGERLYAYVAANRITERCTDETCGYTPPPLPVPPAQVKLLHNLSLRDVRLGIVTSLLFLFVGLQLFISYNAMLVNNLRDRIGIRNTRPDRWLSVKAAAVHKWGQYYLGLDNHDVYMDHHFLKHDHIVALTYVHPDGHEEFLPITDERGITDNRWTRGGNWINWHFYVAGNHIRPKVFYYGVRDWTAFWAGEHGLSLKPTRRFNVKVKRLQIPLQWEKDFLVRQLAEPWIDAGYVEWRDEEFYPHYRDVRKI